MARGGRRPKTQKVIPAGHHRLTGRGLLHLEANVVTAVAMSSPRIHFARGSALLFVVGAVWTQAWSLFSVDLDPRGAPEVAWRDDVTARNVSARNNNTTHPACNTPRSVWGPLCGAGFIRQAEAILNSPDKHMSIVQIGAHTGWDSNDPFVKGMTLYLQSLSPETRQHIDYTLVEASPINHAVLQKKIQKHADLCNLKALWAGVIPDSARGGSGSNLTFYGISSDINVDTGRDARSGKQLPVWASQLSSFSKQNVLKHRRFWKNLGLELEDYIEEMHVETIRFSDLLSQQQGETVFVLIDTEGLDCDIVRALSNATTLPPFLLYEQKHCGRDGGRLAQEDLVRLGYSVNAFDGENVFASRT